MVSKGGRYLDHDAEARAFRDRRSLDRVVRRFPRAADDDNSKDPLLTHEWLVTNGVGGYASGTVCGVATRRFHGVLIAALPTPLGRTMMLNRVREAVSIGDRHFEIGAELPVEGDVHLPAIHHLREFALHAGIPVWTFDLGGATLRKRLFMGHRQNTVYVRYELHAADEIGKVTLQLSPGIHFRPHEGKLSGPKHEDYHFRALSGNDEGTYQIHDNSEYPPLTLRVDAADASFNLHPHKARELRYRLEEERGYDYRGDLYIPGDFCLELSVDHPATLIASTEDLQVIAAMSPRYAAEAEMERRRRLLAVADKKAHSGPASEVVLAADQFLITPSGRIQDVARAHASGDEIKTVIAGYHWFTDWGRDTMISLEGLTLTTGRHNEAGFILRTFSHYIRDGLIPNMFPEGKNDGLYNTADATLWFFHALSRYLEYTDDRPTLRLLLPRLHDIIDHHLRGTRFGIHVDPQDGLLAQGAEGYQLTWMDAKVGDWVVTPRRGKAVEINALWYNALCLLEGWLREEKREGRADEIARHASRCRESFNQRFWNGGSNYLYDVVDVDGEAGKNDGSLRPNQLFSFALENPVLHEERWQPVLDICREKLLTPAGLRSLSPDDPEFKPQYYGDLRNRDAAYHQGTVWAWLIGPYINCFLRVNPGQLSEARKLLDGLVGELSDDCIGSVSEIFDAEPPYTPRGCCAQAWSVAELLRCLVLTTE